MCGIFGIIGRNAPVSVEFLERATRSLTHRGPDDGGTVILRDSTYDSAHEPIEIGLGNRRLAILDLSPQGHQPMHDPATGNWIVYNGEIYNFRDVRTRLENLGAQFRSHTDTEVILKAYAHWDESCLDEFRGMFAFAIWDAQRHRLFVARDPMGIKPLYYYTSDRYFIFSSEVRTLLRTGFVPREIDGAGLVNYLTFGSVSDPNTLLRGVSALPAANFLTWQDGRLEQKQYWDLAAAADTNDGSLEPDDRERREKENQAAEALDESVRMQLVSDVPVGVFLSGGIDSSSLVGILARSGVRPSTFSIIFREAEYSEAEYSCAVAQHFGTDHHEITVSQADFFAAIDPALNAMDLPTIDGVNTYFVSEKTRAAGVKVALSGLGGDEVYAGYSSFRTVPRMERFAHTWKRVPEFVRNPAAKIFHTMASDTDQNRKLTMLARNGTAAVHPYFLSRMLFTPEQQRMLMPSMSWETELPDLVRAIKPLLDNLDRAQNLDPINRVSYLESRCYMLNTLLRDSDVMSMAHGLEVRVPLIDHRLAQKVLRLPGKWKLDGTTPKSLLVRALRGQLPDKIVHRKKRGFTMPFEQWMRDTLRAQIEASIHGIGDGPLGAHISGQAARNVWDGFLNGRTSWSRPWSLYVLHRWCQKYLSS